jgi:hypothetical protein
MPGHSASARNVLVGLTKGDLPPIRADGYYVKQATVIS